MNHTVKRQKKPDRYQCICEVNLPLYQHRKGDIEGVKQDLGAFKDDFLSGEPLKIPGQNNIPVLRSDGNLLSDPTEVAEALTSQYTSQFTRELIDHLPDIDGNQVSSMPDIEFTAPGIEKLLNNLNPAKASGPDLVPARILKLASMEIAPVLSLIYQQSYDTGQVPLDWQQANVTAVFKKGDKTNPANYRPVSLTCIVCKSMEHIICSPIINHLDKHNILVEFQHGFRANHPCEMQLLNTVEDLSRRLERRKWTDLQILDFTNAFDIAPTVDLSTRSDTMKLQEEPTDGLVHGSVTVSNEMSLIGQPHQSRQFSPMCPRALYWVH